MIESSSGMTQRKYMTTEEVAQLFRVSIATVRYWRKVHRGPRAIRIGGLVRWPVAEVAAYEADPEGYQLERDEERAAEWRAGRR
jgi:predicted DNA-binding transcriptional regulator AlpA